MSAKMCSFWVTDFCISFGLENLYVYFFLNENPIHIFGDISAQKFYSKYLLGVATSGHLYLIEQTFESESVIQ